MIDHDDRVVSELHVLLQYRCSSRATRPPNILVVASTLLLTRQNSLPHEVFVPFGAGLATEVRLVAGDGFSWRMRRLQSSC